MRALCLLRPAFGFCLLASPLAEAEAADRAKICALFNATGVLSGIDEGGQYGAELAALESEKVELISFDAISDLGRAVELATRCIDAHDVTVGMGFGDSGFVEATAPIFQRAGRAFVTTAPTAPSLPARIGENLFSVDFGLDDEAEALARFARQRLGVGRVMLWVDDRSSSSQTLSSLFRSAFEADGGVIVEENRYDDDQPDFLTPAVDLAKQLEATPDSLDAVVIAVLPAEAVPAVTALRQAGITLPILGGHGFDGGEWGSADSGLTGGVYYSAAALQGEGPPLSGHFLESYQRHFGAPPAGTSAAVAYDALHLIADAAGRAETPDATGLLEALASTRSFVGVTGPLAYADGRRVPSKPVAILHLERGEGVPVWTWGPPQY